MVKRWTIEPLWKDQLAVIVGGGPSAAQQELRLLFEKPKRNVIAVNHAYKLVPEAAMHFAHDRRWFKWNRDVFYAFRGRMVTTMNPWEEAPPGRMTYVYRGSIKDCFDERPSYVSGRDSGTMAVNLAVHLGAKFLILVGFDMFFPNGQAHWHPDHLVPSEESTYEIFRAQYKYVKRYLDERGIQVINASPISKIKCWPRMTLRQALENYDGLARHLERPDV